MVLTFFDIETTGFNFRDDDILQVGFVRANEEGKIINAGNLYYYQPEFNVEKPDAQRVHGLTREKLLPYEEDYKKNLAGLYTLLQKGYIVGKNSDAFDIPFCKGWLTKVCPGYFTSLTIFRTCDVQTVMKSHYQLYVEQQTGQRCTAKGTLEDYVRMLNLGDFVKKMYDIAQGFAKDEARAGFHDALYDAVATYCVWLVARQQNWVSL